MTSNEAARLAGKLNFAKAQVFGKAGNLALRTIYKRVAMAGHGSLDMDTEWELKWWLKTLPYSRPREIRLANLRKPLIVFTDGSCDPDPAARCGLRAGYGAILFDPENNQYEYLKNYIGDDLLWELSYKGEKKQIVGQAEILPVLFARKLWEPVMKNRSVLYFIDNDAARYSLIKGASDEPTSMTMLSSFWDEDADSPSCPWFARVPSCGNPADDPSRGVDPLDLCANTGSPIVAREVQIPGQWEKELAWSLWEKQEEVYF